MIPKQSLDLHSQSTAINSGLSHINENGELVGCTPTYRNKATKDSLYGYDQNETNTIFEILQRACKKYPNNKLFGYRELVDNEFAQSYTWETYSQIYDQVQRFSNGLQSLCIDQLKLQKSKLSDNKEFLPIGIYSINRKEWVVTDYSCSRIGFVSVALFDTFGPDTLDYIINHAELQLIVASKNKISNLLSIKERLPNLKVIISMDKIDQDQEQQEKTTPSSAQQTPDQLLLSWAESTKVKIYDMDQVKQMGEKANLLGIKPPKHNDLYTICYTSGTTGNPKGAMLNHISFACGSRGMEAVFSDTGLGSHLSYLPLAHCYERVVQFAWIRRGNSVGFYHGDAANLLEDVKILKPVTFISVPRLFNRIYDSIKTEISNMSLVKAKFVEKAIHSKLKNLKEGKNYNSYIHDKILFSKIKDTLGGNIKALFTGSAPISNDVLSFLQGVFGCEFIEGYGLTETSAALCVTIQGEYRPGHCGPPLPCCEIKLIDIPEMNYRSTDKPYPRGEILVRGQNLFTGYFKDEDKTREVLDEDGWFYTGDIGALTPYGTLSVIDRKKNIFKLSQGEYVAPEKVEGIYRQSSYISQAFVYGDSTKSYLVAILIPDEEEFGKLAKKILRNKHMTHKELCKNDEMKNQLLSDINKLARKEKLNGFEILKKIYLDTEPFSVENGMITPTFKLKRPALLKKYKKEIDLMYNIDNKTLRGKDNLEARK